MKNLKKKVAYGLAAVAVAFSGVSDANARDDGGASGVSMPAGCSGGSCGGTTPTSGGNSQWQNQGQSQSQDQTQSINNSGNSSANNAVNNTIKDKTYLTSVYAGPAAAAAGAGCSVVTGFNVGAGVMGVGLTFSDSSADKDFFVLCNNHAQVNEILSQDLCMGMEVAATDTGMEGYRGNPMIRSYIASGPGAARFAQRCNYKVTVTSLKPKGG